MDRIPPISEMVQAVLRHTILLVSIVTVGLVLAVNYALQQPQIFRTAAVVQIGQDAIADPDASAGTNGPALQRLQIIEQRLMARENLSTLIEVFRLYNDPDMSMSDRVAALRNDISLSQITNPDYRWRPDVAPTALLIEVTSGNPDQAAQVANALVENLVAQSRNLRTERIDVTLSFYRSEEARIGGDIAALDSEIAVFKAENAGSLPEALSSQRDKLVTLEEQELALEQEIIEANSSVRPDRGSIDRLLEQLRLLRERKEAVEADIARTPNVERDLNALTRRLQQLNDEYDEVVAIRQEAERGQMLEESQNAESFVVLEPAEVPEHPIAPNRKKIVAMGGAGAFALALALIVILELRNPVLRTSGQMQRQLGILPVVAIPNIELPGARLRRRLLWVSSSALVVLLGVVAIQVAIGQRV